ncbi:MAG: hypothetical protein WBM41_15705 [Arenicellales bacterium]
MTIDISKYSYDELLTINQEIVERLKFLDSVHAFQEMSSLGIGAKVSFESNVGRQTGTIVKFNTKTVGVLTESGRKWNVSPHLLSLIKEVKSNSQVININHNRKHKRKRKK